jgi:hypothetical protein
MGISFGSPVAGSRVTLRDGPTNAGPVEGTDKASLADAADGEAACAKPPPFPPFAALSADDAPRPTNTARPRIATVNPIGATRKIRSIIFP